MKIGSHKLIQTKWGFFQFSPLPTDEELSGYYERKYYQEGRGSYEITYSEEEIAWMALKHWLRAEHALELTPCAKKMLDVGCGEGGLIAEFFDRGIAVTGLDFSSAGIKHLHPEMLEYFRQGNVFTLLEEQCANEKYDIISCINVIEHVTDPSELLHKFRSGLSENGTLIITAPNDYSDLHLKLTSDQITPPDWWVQYPDHLSYFNKQSMTNFLFDHGFSIVSMDADNPVDLNLLNCHCNYINTPSIGKDIHLFRVQSDLFLAGIDKRKLLTLFKTYGDMGVGRNLTYYCKMIK